MVLYRTQSLLLRTNTYGLENQIVWRIKLDYITMLGRRRRGWSIIELALARCILLTRRIKWNQFSLGPLCAHNYRLNWTRRTSCVWWDEMNEVTPPSRHRSRNSGPGGRAGYLSVTDAPHNIESLRVRNNEETFSLKPKGQSGAWIRDLLLSKQAALTTMYRLYHWARTVSFVCIYHVYDKNEKMTSVVPTSQLKIETLLKWRSLCRLGPNKHETLKQCWFDVGGPTSNQHCLNVSVFTVEAHSRQFTTECRHGEHPSKHEALSRCCFNVGPPSTTLAQP